MGWIRCIDEIAGRHAAIDPLLDVTDLLGRQCSLMGKALVGGVRRPGGHRTVGNRIGDGSSVVERILIG